jgi:hypothetical protein
MASISHGVTELDLLVPTLCFRVSLQEMMDIVKAIYDMMGKYTYPVLKEDTPRQHVDVFFQVSAHTCTRALPPTRRERVEGGRPCAKDAGNRKW